MNKLRIINTFIQEYQLVESGLGVVRVTKAELIKLLELYEKEVKDFYSTDKCEKAKNNIESAKFQKGENVKVCWNAGEHRDDFLKHFFKIGQVVQISDIYTGWMRTTGQLAYRIVGSSEILREDELEKV